jgi:hypothetical protein
VPAEKPRLAGVPVHEVALVNGLNAPPFALNWYVLASLLPVHEAVNESFSPAVVLERVNDCTVSTGAGAEDETGAFTVSET